MTNPTPTLAELEEREQKLAGEIQAKRARLEAERAEVIKAANEARAEAARQRITELEQLIPDNLARGEQARRDLVSTLPDSPFAVALATILEAYLTDRVLAEELRTAESVLGRPYRPVLVDQRPDLLKILADALVERAQAGVPDQRPLPDGGTPPLTHEEELFRSRQRGHEDHLMRAYLGLTDEQVHGLDEEQRAAKVAEAKDEEQLRQGEITGRVRAEEAAKRRKDRATLKGKLADQR